MRNILLAVAFLVISTSATTYAQTLKSKQADFSAVDMNGSVVSLSALSGKVVVVNLWFINCPNCLAEIKALNALVEEYKNNPNVVFIAPAASKKYELETFLKKNPFSFRVLPDAAMIIVGKFGTPDKNGNINVPFPMHFVIDRDGIVVVKEQGQKGIVAVRAELAKQFPVKAKP